jgi:Ca2+-binding RTX toxin-like protein
MSSNVINGTSGDDDLTGTSGNDLFKLSDGGDDTAHGLGGDDILDFGATFDGADTLDGGAGSDTVRLVGDYSAGITLAATTLTSVEQIQMGAGFDYRLTTDDGNVAAGASLKINAQALGAGNTLTFDGSAETDGRFDVVAGAGNDHITTGAGNDTIDLRQGGEDTVQGGGGNDVILVGGTLDAGDRLDGGFDGGLGHNVLRLDGDYSAGLTLGATTLANIETLQFAAGHSYDLTADNADFLSGPTVTIDAHTLGAGNALTFDGSAVDANFHFMGGAGDDVLTGGTAADVFDLSKGGNDTASGGGLHDVFLMGDTLTAADRIDGGSGNDTVNITGMGTADSIVFSATTMVNVETLQLAAGASYDLITNDATVAAGATLLVAGNTLGAGDTLTFDGSAETDGHFIVRGGAGNDVLTGGQDGDTFNLVQGGEDTVHGGAGNDTIDMGAAFDSGDQIDGGAGSDTLSLDGTYASAITVSGTMVQNVETVALAGSGYDITWQSPIASGLTVDASAIGSGNSVTFDDSALASGNVHLIAGAGDTVFHGGGGDDAVDLQNSTDGFNVSGGDGDDTVNFGAVYGSNPFQAADGGTGSNTATFDGDYSSGVTVGPSFFFIPVGLRDFQTIELLGGHSYGMNFDDSHGSGATLTGGAALTVDASALGAGDQAYLDFSLSQASGFTVTGGAGDDDFIFAANFSASDTIDGGAGSDTLELNGDYSAGLTFGATTMTNVETLQLDDGSSYNLTTNDATVASGATLTVDASALTGTNALTFDGSAETNGLFAITGGAGNDTVKYGANLSASDTFNGGAGNDTLEIGNTSSSALTFNANTMTNVETLKIDGSVNIILADGNVAAGATLTVDASAAGDHLHVNGSAETDGAFDFIAGTNIADFIGGAGGDSFDMSNETDGLGTEQGNGGDDTFLYAANFNSMRSVVEGGAGSDTLELNGAYTSLGLTAPDVTSVETLKFLGGHSYTGVTVTGDIAAGSTLNIDASAASNLSIDLSAATSAGYAITGGAGDDTITFGSNFSVSDAIDGGAGSDTVNLVNVSGAYTFAATTIANVEDLAITVTDGDSASFTTNDANVAAGATMIVDFSSSGPGIGINTLTFDGSAETDGHFAFIEPIFVTILTLTGGALSDTFSHTQGDGSANTFNGLGGDDTATTTVNAGSLVFDGGTGNDTLAFIGGGTENTYYNLTSVENLTFDDNNWIVDARFNSSTLVSLNVDATALSGGHTITFDGMDTVDGGVTANASFVFEFAGNFISGDSLTGSNNNDTLSLNGDYSAGITFGAAQLTSIEAITVADGHTYSLTTNDANVASGATLTVDASALTGANQLFFDGSAETDGHFAFIGGAGDDDLEGGAQSDTFDLSRSDGAFVYGNGGNDSFTVTSAAHLLDDSIDGGAGSDTLILNGDFSAQTAITAANVVNIETLQLLGASNSYNLVIDGGIAGAATLTIDGSAASSLTVDASGGPSTAYAFIGSAGNDTLTGGGQNDSFNLTLGGNDTVSGGAGNDTFSFGSTFTAADTVDGGANSDTISLSGDYSAGLTFSATNMTSVETLALNPGHSYNLTTNDANVAAGATLNVNAGSLGAGDTLTFDGSAETDGHFSITGGAGNDTVTGGALADTFNLSAGGTDTVHGGGGNDTITVGSSFSAASTIDGGAGSDTVNLVNVSGTYTFAATTIQNVEDLAITVTNGDSASFTTNDANVAAGATMIVDFSSSGPGAGINSLTFDGSAETDGHFAFVEPIQSPA